MAKITKMYWGVKTPRTEHTLKLGDIHIFGAGSFYLTRADAREDIRYIGETGETPIKLRVTIEEVF